MSATPAPPRGAKPQMHYVEALPGESGGSDDDNYNELEAKLGGQGRDASTRGQVVVSPISGKQARIRAQKEAAKCRAAGGESAFLYTQRDFQAYLWDYSEPTIQREAQQGRTLRLDPEQVGRVLNERHPYLKGIGIGQDLITAGGEIGRIVTNDLTRSDDLDLFVHSISDTGALDERLNGIDRRITQNLIQIHGTEAFKYKVGAAARDVIGRSEPALNSAQATGAAERLTSLYDFTYEEVDTETKVRHALKRDARPTFGSHVLRAFEDACSKLSAPVFPIERGRNKGCHTLKWDGGKVQVILRGYRTAAEVLCGFDIDASGIGFDGTDILFSPMGRFAYAFGCNVVDPARASPTYAARLRKYFARGFAVVMPSFEITKVSKRNMTYGEREVVLLPELTMCVESLVENRLGWVRWLRDVRGDDENAPDSDYAGGISRAAAVARNILCLLEGKSEEMVCLASGHEGRERYGIVDCKPTISTDDIYTYYAVLGAKLYVNGRLNVKVLKTNYPLADFAELSKLCFGTDEGKIQDYLAELNLRQIRSLVLVYETMTKSPGWGEVPWVMENPGQQLSSTHHPEPVSEKEWYGEYWSGP